MVFSKVDRPFTFVLAASLLANVNKADKSTLYCVKEKVGEKERKKMGESCIFGIYIYCIYICVCSLSVCM